MVVGNGLIARSFHDFAENEDVIIFASGVSNSLSRDASAYQREKDLIDRYKSSKMLFVYFSTISVLAPCMQESAYVIFKKEMEQYIAEQFQRYIIFRLPNLVGRSDNPNTLTNFIAHQIVRGNKLEIHKHATRYLLDVDHMAMICRYFINNGQPNKTYDIVLNNKTTISAIVKELENIFNTNVQSNDVPKGCDVSITPIEPFILQQIGLDHLDINNYNHNLLAKYYKALRDKFPKSF
jgi:nucleoside-diphosphate-sugar epimerase